MDPKIIWLFVFVAIYWAYCIFWGIKGAFSSRTASDYFIAGRQISVWVYILAATATSFSGWTFIGHPGLIYRDGLQYAHASFYALTIPLTGILFLKRQWLLGKHFGYVTPGEMFSDYYRSETLRVLIVVVALVFSIPYLGVQLRASGYLFNILTDGMLSIDFGMWMLSSVILLYVASGGLRAVAYVDTIQAILLALGIVLIGCIVLYYVGGIHNLLTGIALLSQFDTKLTPEGYSHYISLSGPIQWVSDSSQAVGGAWTGTMTMTYLIALMGIQASPAFSMWAFSNNNPRPFAPQQVWASAFGIGFILIVFTAIQGLGGHLLGANIAFITAHPEAVNNMLGSVLGDRDIMQTPSRQEALVPALIHLLADDAPYLVAFLAICALAAMQSTASAYMSTAGGMLTRDLFKRFLIPKASHGMQKLLGRFAIVLITLAALAVASSSNDALVLLGGLAVAYGLQMYPALIGICWWSFLTREGIIVGLIAGLIAVTMTDAIGGYVFSILGITPWWGRYPLTIHSAGWGILFNLPLAIIVSFFTQRKEDREYRAMFHDLLQEHAGLSEHKYRWVPVAWILMIAWFIIGVGPGSVIGNWIFGDPRHPETWLFGIPSLWAWQILFWALGVALFWFLAYFMEMSTVPKKEVDSLQEDIGDIVTKRN